MDIRIEDNASAELAAKIGQLTGAQRRAILKACGMEILAMATTAFKEPSQRPAPWPQLTAQTLARRKAKGHKGTAPLRASGTLFKSLRALAPSDNSVEVLTDRKYARIQQFGGKVNIPGYTLRPKKAKALYWPGARHPVKSVKMPPRTVTIPPRPFMPLDASGNVTDAAADRVMKIVEAKVAAIFKE